MCFLAVPALTAKVNRDVETDLSGPSHEHGTGAGIL